jgi:hypothetical protein
LDTFKSVAVHGVTTNFSLERHSQTRFPLWSCLYGKRQNRKPNTPSNYVRKREKPQLLVFLAGIEPTASRLGATLIAQQNQPIFRVVFNQFWVNKPSVYGIFGGFVTLPSLLSY